MKKAFKRLFAAVGAILTCLLISVARKKHIRRFDDAMKKITEFQQR